MGSRGMKLRALSVGVALILATASSVVVAAPSGDSTEPAFRALYKELVETNTTHSVGSCTQAAEAMRRHLLDAGIPAADTQVIAPQDRPKDGALIALLRGKDASLKPLLLLAHIDVVEAKRQDWVRDPFKLTEENGWFYARGVADDKATADVFNSVRWLTRDKPEALDAAFALNEGAGGELDASGRAVALQVQAGEKV